MTSLNAQFQTALSKIELGEKQERVIKAHQEIRKLLESDDTLREWGIDTILIGSYSRDTAIYPGKDVDVFARFQKLDAYNANPRDLYDLVSEVLENEYGLVSDGGRATPRDRSIKVAFPAKYENVQNSSFAVDIVPAVQKEADWAIPTKKTEIWSQGEEHWVVTNPIKLGESMSELNQSSIEISDQHAFKPIVKLMRQIRQHHLGDDRPNGLYVELATYDVWRTNSFDDPDWASLLASTLTKVADRFYQAAASPILDPALNKPAEPLLSEHEYTEAYTKFDKLADKANDMLGKDSYQAATIWREILGKNDRGFVFPLPEGREGKGYPTTQVVSKPRVEAPRFG